MAELALATAETERTTSKAGYNWTPRKTARSRPRARSIDRSRRLRTFAGTFLTTGLNPGRCVTVASQAGLFFPRALQARPVTALA